MRVVGVDPGTSGALAMLDTDTGKVAIIDMPTRTYARAGKKTKAAVRKFVDGHKVCRWLQKYEPDVAIIESVHSFGNEGRASLAKFLTAFGVVLGSVQSFMGDAHILVTPPVWKRRLNLIGKPKEASYRLACKLFPAYRKLMVGPRGGAKVDRAEALLIAYQYTL